MRLILPWHQKFYNLPDLCANPERNSLVNEICWNYTLVHLLSVVLGHLHIWYISMYANFVYPYLGRHECSSDIFADAVHSACYLAQHLLSPSSYTCYFIILDNKYCAIIMIWIAHISWKYMIFRLLKMENLFFLFLSSLYQTLKNCPFICIVDMGSLLFVYNLCTFLYFIALFLVCIVHYVRCIFIIIFLWKATNICDTYALMVDIPAVGIS